MLVAVIELIGPWLVSLVTYSAGGPQSGFRPYIPFRFIDIIVTNITLFAKDGADLMGLVMTLARQAKTWLKKDLTLFPKEPTLRELMAKRGLNEFGRTGATTSSLAPQKQPSLDEYTVMFVTEFSYDTPSQLRVSVVALNSREFHGFCHENNAFQSFSWGKVRGLMRIVDSGEMLSPYEAFDKFH